MSSDLLVAARTEPSEASAPQGDLRRLYIILVRAALRNKVRMGMNIWQNNSLGW